jgi:hypothetical protein
VLLGLTIALVLAGLGLLLAGAVRDALGLIYLSILCTAIAGVALIVYVQVSRRREVGPAAGEDSADGGGGQEHVGAGPVLGSDTGPSGPSGLTSAEVEPGAGSGAMPSEGPSGSEPAPRADPGPPAGSSAEVPSGDTATPKPETARPEPETGSESPTG